jgi:hypothetical protein
MAINFGEINPKVNKVSVCSNEETGPFQRGENHKNATIGLGHLKIFL